jgi:hypothetical protein
MLIFTQSGKEPASQAEALEPALLNGPCTKSRKDVEMLLPQPFMQSSLGL